jgi:hypothetical protein
MAATVEIKTGRGRILKYLFSPLAEVASEAMQEDEKLFRVSQWLMGRSIWSAVLQTATHPYWMPRAPVMT